MNEKFLHQHLSTGRGHPVKSPSLEVIKRCIDEAQFSGRLGSVGSMIGLVDLKSLFQNK